MAEENNENLGVVEESAPKNYLLTVIVLLNTLALCVIGYFQFQSFQKISTAPTVSDIVAQIEKQKTYLAQPTQRDGWISTYSTWNASSPTGCESLWCCSQSL